MALHLAAGLGATVLRGLEGFGAHSRIHPAKILRLATDLPIVIEIVDPRDKIERFLPLIDGAIREGLATTGANTGNSPSRLKRLASAPAESRAKRAASQRPQRSLRPCAGYSGTPEPGEVSPLSGIV